MIQQVQCRLRRWRSWRTLCVWGTTFVVIGAMTASAATKPAAAVEITNTMPAQASATLTQAPVAPGTAGINQGSTLEASPPAIQRKVIAAMAAAGAHWIRVNAFWVNIQTAQNSELNWAEPDAVVRPALADHLHVLVVLDGIPPWADNTDGTPNATDYGRFAQAAARHFGPMGVQAFEVDNEPNYTSNWGGTVQELPQSYVSATKAVYQGIKAVDRSALVVAGAVATACCTVQASGIPMPVFVKDILADGICPYMDALSVHPYAAPLFPLQRSIYNYFPDLPNFHREMLQVSQNCGSKRIWATEVGVTTAKAGPSDPVNVTGLTPYVQAAMLFQFYNITRKWSFMGPVMWYNWQDSGVDAYNPEYHYGLLYYDGAPKPALAAFEQAADATNVSTPEPRIVTRSLPNGQVGKRYMKIVAASGGTGPYVWTVAMVGDPVGAITAGSLPAGLTLDELSGEIYGAPTTAGVTTFRMQLLDAEGHAVTKNFSISVSPPVSATPVASDTPTTTARATTTTTARATPTMSAADTATPAATTTATPGVSDTPTAGAATLTQAPVAPRLRN